VVTITIIEDEANIEGTIGVMVTRTDVKVITQTEVKIKMSKLLKVTWETPKPL